MNFTEFVKAMRELGYSEAGAEDLVWVADSPENLTQAPFNFVPTQNPRFHIMQPDGRDGYFVALRKDHVPFEGTWKTHTTSSTRTDWRREAWVSTRARSTEAGA